MKVFITGYKGYVGSELVKRGFTPLVCDVTNWSEVEREINRQKPQLLIHLAGKSNVNWCEKKENEDEVIKTNVRGVWNVFENLARLRLPGVLLSTDQTWRGWIFESHKEESKKTPPVNFYGLSKVAAESVAASFNMNVIRTSYLFDSKRLADRIVCMERGIRQDQPVFIRRSFMHLGDFCDQVERYCSNFYKMPKTLHLSGSETVSWHGFMKKVAKQYGFKGVVKPRFREVESGAPRPYFGGLNTKLSHSLGFPPVSYTGGIERMRSEG